MLVRCVECWQSVAAGVFLSGGGGKLAHHHQHMCREAFFSPSPRHLEDHSSSLLLLQLASSDSSTGVIRASRGGSDCCSLNVQPKYQIGIGLMTFRDPTHQCSPFIGELFLKINKKNVYRCL